MNKIQGNIIMNFIFKISFILLSIGYTNYSYADDQDDLKSTYGKLLALSSTSDISASTLKDDEGVHYSKYSLPLNFNDLYTHGNYAFSLGFRFNYFNISGNTLDLSYGKISPHWNIFNLVAIPKISYKLNEKFTLEGELEYGYSRMENKSKFDGSKINEEALKKENLLDWNANAVHLTPKIGLKYKNKLRNNNEINLNTHVGYMILSNFNNKENLRINNRIGTWSVGGEYVINDAFKVYDRGINIAISNDIGGFYGDNYRELSFGFVNSTSVALETPIKLWGETMKLKTGVGYLLNDNAHGAMFILGLE